MAKCIAWAKGIDLERWRQESRMGTRAAEGRAATWRTEAIAYVDANGAGYVEVKSISTGKIFHHFEFGPESEREG